MCVGTKFVPTCVGTKFHDRLNRAAPFTRPYQVDLVEHHELDAREQQGPRLIRPLRGARPSARRVGAAVALRPRDAELCTSEP